MTLFCLGSYICYRMSRPTLIAPSLRSVLLLSAFKLDGAGGQGHLPAELLFRLLMSRPRGKMWVHGPPLTLSTLCLVVYVAEEIFI